jgi:hypothetical protein
MELLPRTLPGKFFRSEFPQWLAQDTFLGHLSIFPAKAMSTPLFIRDFPLIYENPASGRFKPAKKALGN